MNFKETIKQSPFAPVARSVYQALRMVKNARHIFTPKMVVITYHRVAQLANDPEQLAVTPQQLEEHLVYLKQHYHIVSLQEFFEKLKNKKISGKEVLITFDDGYQDNYLNAFPLLKKYGVPATIFVAGNGQQKYEFWWDELARLPIKENRSQLHHRLKTAEPILREKILADAFAQYGIQRNIEYINQFCTTEQFSEMVTSGLITLGGHTLNHVQLSALDSASQQYDISENYTYLKGIAGNTPIAFAYPYGSSQDYNDDSVVAVKKYYQLAFTTEKKVVVGTVDQYRIPRFIIKSWDKSEFARRIKNFFTRV